jgi:glycosyltransferase involved in cell wall biosynthesis
LTERRLPISVLLPVYNAGPYLAAAIDSILVQSYSDFEMVVIDDGSTDGSGDVIEGYADSRIRFLRATKNVGLIATLNRGIAVSRGEFIARMDQDDISHPDRLELQLRRMKENPGDSFCCSWYEVLWEGRPPKTERMPATGEEIRAELLFSNIIAHSTVMIRRAALDRAGGAYDPGCRYCEDYELWLRLSKLGGIGVIPRVLLKYRVLSGSESRAEPSALRENVRRMWERSFSALEFAVRPEELASHMALTFRDRLHGGRQWPAEVGRWINRLYSYAAQKPDDALARVVVRRATLFLSRQSLPTLTRVAATLNASLRRKVLAPSMPAALLSSLPRGTRDLVKRAAWQLQRKTGGA